MIIKELANEFREDIKCIPCDKEKYKTFSIPIKYVDNKYPVMLKFIDSFHFLSTKLESLVNNLSDLYTCKCVDNSTQHIKIEYDKYYIYTSCTTCNYNNKQKIKSLISKFSNTYQLANNDIEKFVLLLQKGEYAHEYIDDWSKFDEKELPNINKLHSNLNLSDITLEKYEHAKNVWKTFNISNMGEYDDIYVEGDTTQLADIFEQFRTRCLREYKLDPAYYCTASGLALDACLKYTNVKIELITDENMYLVFEKGIRGGISQVIQRHAIANNK